MSSVEALQEKLVAEETWKTRYLGTYKAAYSDWQANLQERKAERAPAPH